MRISTDWLADYLSPVPATDVAGEALTMAGYPVEEVDVVDGVDVMDVEITSNRPDLFSHVGVARELAAVAGGTFKVEAAEPTPSGEPLSIDVAIDAGDRCPHYTARLLRDVTVGPSPQWMQRRLIHVGLRPINNVVDVTNYVLFELGQPLHAFDADRFDGNVVVRLARDGEILRTLDGIDRKLTATDLVIADQSKAIALAGVMGGEATEVTAETKNVLLESARFDPLSVRNTSRRLKLQSDSSFRFERGLDPTLAHRASKRAAQLIIDTAGATLANGVAEAGSDARDPAPLAMRWSRLERLLGVELPRAEVITAFEKLGLKPRETGDGVETSVPSHRLDLSIEADLIEEAARVVGYDRIPERETITVRVRPADNALRANDVIRDAMTAAGCDEAVTFSFVGDALKEHFLPGDAKLRRVDANVRKADGHLRPSLLPGLLQSVRHNEAVGNGVVRLFEVGAAFWSDDNGPSEVRRLGLAGGESYAACRGILEAVLGRLDPSRKVVVEPAEAPGFGKGACGRVIWGDEAVGHVGLCEAAVVEALDLRHTPTIAELDYDALVRGLNEPTSPGPLARFPAATRDLSLVVADRVAYGELAGLANELDLVDLVGVEHGGTYRGKPLDRGTKSVTLTLVFRRDDATVPREHAEGQVERLAKVAQERFNATVRT